MITRHHWGSFFGYHGAGLLPGLFVLCLLLAAPACSAWSEADWLAGRLPESGETVTPKDAEGLVRAVRLGDPRAMLYAIRSLDRETTTAWVRREALLLILQHFCITDALDSLDVRRRQLHDLYGLVFACAGDPGLAVVPDTRVHWCLQLGAFSSKSNASRLLNRLKHEKQSLRVVEEGGLFRALAGSWASEEEAQRMAADWKRRGLISEYSVREEP